MSTSFHPWILLACALSVGAQAPPPFRNREMIPTGSVGILSTGTGSTARFTVPPGHRDFASKALLITSLDVVNSAESTFDVSARSGSPHNRWAFPHLFRLMLSRQGQQDADRITGNWLSDIAKPDVNFIGAQAAIALKTSWGHFHKPNTPVLASAPFRLLAIVYRPDLARLSGNAVCGDEVRFTFGSFGPDGAGNSAVSVIFEAVMPCQPYKTFYHRVRAWASVPGVADRHAALAKLTDHMLGHAHSLRFRLVTRDNAEWRAKEFAWSPQSKSLQSIPMERNFNLLTSMPPDFFTYIQNNQQQIRNGFYSLPQGLLSRDALMKPNQKVLCLPAPFQADEALRVILSRNTCAGCHTTETGAPFVHIRTRPHNAESPLSRFLTGGGDDWSQPHAVSITRDNCESHHFSAPPRQHFYNDLLRRHLFLRAVLALRPAQFSPSEWNQRIHPYSIGEVH